MLFSAVPIAPPESLLAVLNAAKAPSAVAAAPAASPTSIVEPSAGARPPVPVAPLEVNESCLTLVYPGGSVPD